jgi:hypothetical protein
MLQNPKGMGPKIIKILHDAFEKGMEDGATFTLPSGI